MSKVYRVSDGQELILSGALLQDLSALPVATVSLSNAQVASTPGSGSASELAAMGRVTSGNALLVEVTPKGAAAFVVAASVRAYQDMVFYTQSRRAVGATSIIQRTARGIASSLGAKRSCCGN